MSYILQPRKVIREERERIEKIHPTKQAITHPGPKIVRTARVNLSKIWAIRDYPELY